MRTDSERHTLAELAALLQLQAHAFSKMGVPANAAATDRDLLTRLIHDAGLQDLEKLDFADLPVDEAEMIREMAKARYSSITAGSGL